MKLLIRFGPSLAGMAVIFWFSSQTGDSLNQVLPFFQWLFPAMQGFDWGHFAAYFLLACTFLWGLAGEEPQLASKGLAVILCLLYGVTDEYHQTFVPGRMPDLLDLRNDGIGALLAMAAVSLPPVRRLYRKLPHAKKY